MNATAILVLLSLSLSQLTLVKGACHESSAPV